MKFLKSILTLLLTFISLNAQENKNSNSPNIHGIKVLDANKNEISLADYKNKVLLIVNVASECGFTKQYKDLQALYEKYKEQGLEIIAFPCNDFGGQEPGTNKEIAEFCEANYGVNFTLFDKVKIIGDDKSELYKILTNNTATGNGKVKWNFEKFIISKDGNIVKRFGSRTKPFDEKLIAIIDKELK